jgi:hypothetical protein
MHTLSTGGWDIHHDSGWDGDVIITAPGEGQHREAMTVPFKVLAAIIGTALGDKLIGAIEDLEGAALIEALRWPLSEPPADGTWMAGKG